MSDLGSTGHSFDFPEAQLSRVLASVYALSARHRAPAGLQRQWAARELMTVKGRLARLRPPHQRVYRAQTGAVRQRPTPTQARSRLVKGEDGPSDSALAAA